MGSRWGNAGRPHQESSGCLRAVGGAAVCWGMCLFAACYLGVQVTRAVLG